MKRIAITLFMFLGFNALAQRPPYGKPQPLKPGDTTMVLRTSKDSLIKLTNTRPKGRGLASNIEVVEESLDYDRAVYLKQQPKGFYENQLPGIIGMMQRSNFPGVEYYMREYVLYHPDYAKDHTVAKKP